MIYILFIMPPSDENVIYIFAIWRAWNTIKNFEIIFVFV